MRKGRLWIVKGSPFQFQLLKFIHSNPTSGHSGYHKTVHRAKLDFYWKGMRNDIKKFVWECEICQVNKHEIVHPAGLLQPLPIPSDIWADISMDFIEGLPPSHGYIVILVVIAKFSKYGHFLPVSDPYTASIVAHLFLSQIFKLHGMHQTIVSDRDPLFISSFWRELFHLQGISLAFSFAYHPQSDGQTESLNKCLETYLCCYSGSKPKDWSTGCLWLNGGITLTIIPPRVSLLLKLYTDMLLHPSSHMCRALPLTWRWITSLRIAPLLLTFLRSTFSKPKIK